MVIDLREKGRERKRDINWLPPICAHNQGLNQQPFGVTTEPEYNQCNIKCRC